MEGPKLTIKIVDLPSGRRLALCDDRGYVLPGQTEVVLETGYEGVPKLRVEFVVDGDDVRLVGEAR